MSDKKSLIVDDDPSVRKFIKAVLESDGHQTTEAENGVQALDLLRKACGAVDLLVSDIKMPVMDGIALACSVRAEFPAIQIILISGYAATEQGHQSSTAFEFLQKPFLPATLLTLVKKVTVLKGRSASTETRAMSAKGGAG
jgi:two-component system cell cycle response regulator CpdR